MHVAINPERETGVIVLDRIYHYDSRLMPAPGGGQAIVVTPYGEIRAAWVEDADARNRTAKMPMDGPGYEIGRHRLHVSVVGAVVRTIGVDLGDFVFKAGSARGLADACHTGPGLRDRVRAAITEAAGQGLYEAKITTIRVAEDEVTRLGQELRAAGYEVLPSNTSLTVWWEPAEAEETDGRD